MMKRWLRWLAVLPGAAIVGLLITFPLHWILFQTLGNVAELERIVSPLAIGVCFIWVGSRIAPAHKFETAAILFGLWLFSLGAAVGIAAFGGNIEGYKLFMQGSGLGPAMAFIGAA